MFATNCSLTNRQLINPTIAISLPTQSLQTTAPSAHTQFAHHTSLLKSHSGAQRQEHLAALTTHLSTNTQSSSLPEPPSVLLSILTPLILDPDNRVRSQLLKTLPLLPTQDVGDSIANILLRIRAGMTHLSPDIRSTSLDLLAWTLNTVPLRLVSCAGGWVKTLKSFITVLGWPIQEPDKGKGEWTSTTSTATGPVTVKTLNILATFLRHGLLPPASVAKDTSARQRRYTFSFPLSNTEAHMLPIRSNAFGHLNLFGPPRDEEREMYEDVRDRRRVFKGLGYEAAIARGVEGMKKGAGEVGRAAANIGKVLKEVES
ncbi:MAG: hypothetical protein Q9164_005017 [Protoblastenia rupestris]